MMRAGTILNFDDKIVYISVLDKGRLAVAERTNTFYIIDMSTMDKLHQLTFKHADSHSEKNNISFSLDGKYLAYSEKEQSVVRVIDIEHQKLYHSFPTLNNPIETLCFDPNSHYLVAGSVTGRVFLWNLFSTGQVARLSSFPEYTPHLFVQPKINYVSCACFNATGNIVATAGYGGSIVITNIHTEVAPKRITPNHVRINTLCFINENFLAAGNVEGGLDIIDIQNSQIYKHFQTALGSVKQLAVSHSGSYLFASGNTSHIALIDLKAKKIIEPEYIRSDTKITRLAITKEDHLFIGCEDGTLNVFHASPVDLLELRLNTASYAQAYELLYKFPLLRESELALKLDDIWQETLKEAIDDVEHKKIDEAVKRLNKFSHVNSKKEILQEFQNLTAHYERFKVAVMHENYALAYSMADHVPLLKETLPYQEMEKIWDETFLKAQVYTIKEQTHQLFKALEPFSRVTSKLCFIQVLLHRPELFIEFTQLIYQHAYARIFEIVNQYPCLKEIRSYQNILDASHELYEKTRQDILMRRYEHAQIQLQELSNIPYMKRRFQELTQLLLQTKRIEGFLYNDDLLSCYSLVDKHEELKELPLVKELEEQWNDKIKAAEKEALLGHTKEIKHLLGKLLTLSSRSQKIGMLLRLSFLTQIKLLVIKQQTPLLQEAIENYIQIFGYDTELNNLILKLKKDKLATIVLSPEQEHRRPRSLWLELTGGNIPDTIVKNKKEDA